MRARRKPQRVPQRGTTILLRAVCPTPLGLARETTANPGCARRASRPRASVFNAFGVQTGRKRFGIRRMKSRFDVRDATSENPREMRSRTGRTQSCRMTLTTWITSATRTHRRKRTGFLAPDATDGRSKGIKPFIASCPVRGAWPQRVRGIETEARKCARVPTELLAVEPDGRDATRGVELQPRAAALGTRGHDERQSIPTDALLPIDRFPAIDV